LYVCNSLKVNTYYLPSGDKTRCFCTIITQHPTIETSSKQGFTWRGSRRRIRIFEAPWQYDLSPSIRILGGGLYNWVTKQTAINILGIVLYWISYYKTHLYIVRIRDVLECDTNVHMRIPIRTTQDFNWVEIFNFYIRWIPQTSRWVHHPRALPYS